MEVRREGTENHEKAGTGNQTSSKRRANPEGRLLFLSRCHLRSRGRHRRKPPAHAPNVRQAFAGGAPPPAASQALVQIMEAREASLVILASSERAGLFILTCVTLSRR